MKFLKSLMNFMKNFQSIPNYLPSSFRVILVIYALIVLYRVNENEIEVFESIGVAIFPAFFIGYIATISPEYLNLMKPVSEIEDKRPELGLMAELKSLRENEIRTLFIFVPIYILITYQLNKKIIHNLFNIITLDFSTSHAAR